MPLILEAEAGRSVSSRTALPQRGGKEEEESKEEREGTEKGRERGKTKSRYH